MAFEVELLSSEIAVTLTLEKTVGGEGGGVTSWDDLEDKPATFPPSAHNHDDRYYTDTETDTLLDAKADLVDGVVPAIQLPSYVDDVIEAANFAALPVTGETAKIYATLDDNKTYRWTGTIYAEISASLALGETLSTAYRGDRGKTAYDHSQLTTGNPHNVTKTDIGLGNVPNTDATARANHTGTQTASTISDFNTSVDARLTNIGKYSRPYRVAINDYFLTTMGLGAAYQAAGSSSTAANSNSRAKFTPFYIAETISVDALALHVVGTNGGASAVVRLGIYDDVDGRPANVIVDAGTASINSSSMKTLTFTPVVLTPGFYWAVFVPQDLDTAGGNPTFSSVSGTAAIGETAPSASNNMFPVALATITGALTANPTISYSRATTASCGHIWLRRSA